MPLKMYPFQAVVYCPHDSEDSHERFLHHDASVY
jgi:hypothetical protein